MVKAMDDSIGQVLQLFKNYNLYDNTIIIFSSDNGGLPSAGGYNYPLKGEKNTVWEGAVKSLAFISGPGVSGNSSFEGLFHVTDWMPSLLGLVGCEDSGDGGEHELDGVDQSGTFFKDSKVPIQPLRNEILINIDPLTKMSHPDNRTWVPNSIFNTTIQAAIIKNNLKLITGYPGDDKTFKPPELYQDELIFCTQPTKNGKNLSRNGKLEKIPQSHKINEHLNVYDNSETKRALFLFDLDQDINEEVDLSNDIKYRDIILELLGRLGYYYETVMIEPNEPKKQDVRSFPEKLGGYWGSWV